MSLDPDDGWPIFKTRPTTSETEPRWSDHAWSVGFAVVGLCLIGVPLFFLGVPGLSLLGFVFVFSPVFSWAGFLMGVPLTLLVLRTGYAGWGTFPLLGLCVGTVYAPLLGSALTIFLGPILAALYGWLLRRFVPEAFLPR